MYKLSRLLLAGCTAVALVAAGCGSDDGASSADTAAAATAAAATTAAATTGVPTTTTPGVEGNITVFAAAS